jgi:SAM-dependent methyltransferase
MGLDSHFKEYFNYLRRRKFLGYIYRRFFLYPRLNSKLTGKVLDFGCGIGDFIASRPNSIGVDINPYSIKFCAKRKLKAFLIKEGKLPFEKADFDSVLMDNVLEHVNNPESILIEIKRILKVEGILLIGVPGVKGYASDADHKLFYAEADLLATAAKCGFEVDHFFYMPLIKSYFLSKYLRQYVLYSLWVKR